MEISGRGVDSIVIFASIVVPMIITPAVVWYIVSLLLEVHRLEEEQRHLATYDMLTGLMTRRAFLESSSALIKLMGRKKTLMALAYIDIDNFKNVNDIHGHAGGDEVLKSFASLLHGHLRESDLVGRIGGEEFAIALPYTDLNNSIDVLEKIRLSSKNDAVNCSSKTIQYTISIGVTIFDSDNPVNLEQLATQSDNALYKAKNSGKDCIVKYKANNEN
jgi:diguanylate cyclase (GGDEF)-like protein